MDKDISRPAILFLGDVNSPLAKWLELSGERIVKKSDRLDCDAITPESFQLIISYGYKYLLDSKIVRQYRNRAINLHISYLPWNRGDDPNLWSFLENTPKGVSIHLIDEGVDTGDLIAQKRVYFDLECNTLATTYEHLQQAIQELFKENWPEIKEGVHKATAQKSGGTYHKVADKQPYLHLLSPLKWDTPVNTLVGKACRSSLDITRSARAFVD